MCVACQVRHPASPLRLYLMLYQDSVEEQKYITRLRKVWLFCLFVFVLFGWVFVPLVCD